MQIQEGYLQSSVIASRMRLGRSKLSVGPPPRSSAAYLRKQPGTDVWLPVSHDSRSSTISTRSLIQAISSTVDSVPKTPTAIKKSPRPSVEPVVSRDASKHQVFDFALRASEWRQSQSRNFSFKWLSFDKARLSNYALVGMATIVFVGGMLASLHSFMTDKQLTNTVQAAMADDVEETPPSDEESAAYSVAPDMPRFLKIPRLNVSARVRAVGLDSQGRMGSPQNIHDVAWYNGSVKPGSPGGASVIDGHVSGPTSPGVLKRLEIMAEGDEIIIERGDGELFTYRAVRIEVVPVNEVNMTQVMTSVTVGKHGLNVITCAGKFDSSSQSYSHRAIVFAEAI